MLGLPFILGGISGDANNSGAGSNPTFNSSPNPAPFSTNTTGDTEHPNHQRSSVLAIRVLRDYPHTFSRILPHSPAFSRIFQRFSAFFRGEKTDH